MAISDFKLLATAAADSTTWSVTGISGAIAAHSTLSSPLSGEGTYCRNWQNSSATTFYFSAVPDTANFKTLPSTKAASIRCWLRCSSALPIRFGLFAKAHYAFVYDRGYNFFVNSNGYFGLNFGQANDYDNLKKYPSSLGVGLFDRWIHMRMDVIPVKNSSNIVVADRIKCFATTEALGSENWQLIADTFAEVTVPTGKISPFIAWGSATNPYYGFGTHSIGQADTTTLTTNYNNKLNFYADHFKMLVKTL